MAQNFRLHSEGLRANKTCLKLFTGYASLRESAKNAEK